MLAMKSIATEKYTRNKPTFSFTVKDVLVSMDSILSSGAFENLNKRILKGSAVERYNSLKFSLVASLSLMKRALLWGSRP